VQASIYPWHTTILTGGSQHAKGGTITIFAAHTATVPVQIEKVYQQELSSIPRYSSSPEDPRSALNLLATAVCKSTRFSSRYLPQQQFHEGKALTRQRAALKVYVRIAGELYGK